MSEKFINSLAFDEENPYNFSAQSYLNRSIDENSKISTAAFVLGSACSANINHSVAAGLSTIAGANGTLAVGKFNTVDNSKNAFIIGNGTSKTQRSDAIIIDWNGNVSATGNIYSTGELLAKVKDYYTKTELYTKTEIDEKLSKLGSFMVVPAGEITDNKLKPEDAKNTYIYLEGPFEKENIEDLYKEWIVVQNIDNEKVWTMIGTTEVDITGKMDKISNPTAGNIAVINEDGNVTDGGINIDEINNYTAGNNINISDDNEISVTGTKELISDSIIINDTNENVSLEVNEEWLADHTVSDSYLTRAKNEGSVTVSSSYALGTSVSALGIGSVVFGRAKDHSNIIAYGAGSFAGGYAQTSGTISASGNGAFAVGASYNNSKEAVLASGNGAIAMGIGASAIAGNFGAAVAIGREVIASGECANAQGFMTSALGNYSHAEGLQTSAKGVCSHAEGYGTIAYGETTHAQGKYNTTANATKAFIIGNGTSDAARSDALVVDWNGNVSAVGYFYDKNGKVGDTVNEASVLASQADDLENYTDFKTVTPLTTYILNTNKTLVLRAATTSLQYNQGLNIDIVRGGNPANIKLAYQGSKLYYMLVSSYETYNTFNIKYKISNTEILIYITHTNNSSGSSRLKINRLQTSNFLAIMEIDTANIPSDASTAGKLNLHADKAGYLEDAYDNTKRVYANWYGNGISKVTTTGTEASANSRYLIGGYRASDGGHFAFVDAGNIQVGSADNANKANLLKINNTDEINFANTAANPPSAVWFNYRVVKSNGSTANSAVYKTYKFANGSGGDISNVTAYTDTISALHFVGRNCTVNGLDAIAFGRYTSAIQNYAMAAGVSSIASGWYSHAEGKSTSALGGVSHAEGESTYAANEHAHAEGKFTSALGSRSHAEGLSAIASGDVSHAEGKGTSAIGYASHAEGEYTMANGNYSHAAGSGTTAVNEGVFAHGKGLKLAYNYGIALGRFNKTSGGDTLLVVGNGNAEDKRNDAFLIDGWGNVSAAGTISDKNGRLTNLTKVNSVSEITDDGAFYII